jgi:hypothetical protein
VLEAIGLRELSPVKPVQLPNCRVIVSLDASVFDFSQTNQLL